MSELAIVERTVEPDDSPAVKQAADKTLVWETFDAMFKTVYRLSREVEGLKERESALEERVALLEHDLAEARFTNQLVSSTDLLAAWDGKERREDERRREDAPYEGPDRRKFYERRGEGEPQS